MPWLQCSMPALPITPHQPSQATSTRTHNGLPQMKSDLWRSICFRSTASDPSVSPENHCECNFRIPDLFTQTTDYEHLMSKAKYTHLSTATNSDCKRTSWWLRGKPLQGVQLHFSIPDSGTEIQAELRMQHKKSDSEPPLLPVVCRKGWWMQSKYCYYRCQPKTTYTFNKAS